MSGKIDNIDEYPVASLYGPPFALHTLPAGISTVGDWYDEAPEKKDKTMSDWKSKLPKVPRAEEWPAPPEPKVEVVRQVKETSPGTKYDAGKPALELLPPSTSCLLESSSIWFFTFNVSLAIL
jgi:hypothetical protein